MRCARPLQGTLLALCIFLAEDNPIIRANLTETVRDFVGEDVVGYATSEVEALTWLISRSEEWDLAILDLFLQRGNGLSVLSGCRVRRPSQKVVVLSNYATPDMRRRCIGLGADAVFDKSTELHALLDYCIELKQRATGRS